MTERDRLFEFLLDANVALLGAALVYWSKPLAHSLNRLAVRFYKRFPKLKLLPGAELAGSDLNYKSTYIYFRVLGILVFLSAAIFVTLLLRIP